MISGMGAPPRDKGSEASVEFEHVFYMLPKGPGVKYVLDGNIFTDSHNVEKKLFVVILYKAGLNQV
jgi:hypothetical protein